MYINVQIVWLYRPPGGVALCLINVSVAWAGDKHQVWRHPFISSPRDHNIMYYSNNIVFGS